MMTIGIGKAEINKVLGKGAKAPEPIPSKEVKEEVVVKPKRTRKKKEE